MRVRIFAIVAAALPSLPSPGALASPDLNESVVSAGDIVALDLEELLLVKQITVSSSKEENVFTSPSTVTVIDRKTIELYGFTSVAEAVSTLAGVSVQRTSLMRDIPTVRGVLQDHYTNKVLVLIDGTPSWMANTGEGNINRVSIDDVERIEVLRGPASVVHGTNAYSGSINLVLRRAQAPAQEGSSQGGQVRTGVGNEGYLTTGGHYRYAKNGLSLFVSAAGGKDKGVDWVFLDGAGTSGHVRDFIESSSVSLRLELEGTRSRHRVLLNGYSGREGFLGVVPEFRKGAGGQQERSGYLVSYQLGVPLGEKLELRGGVTFDWNHRSFPRTGDTLVRSDSTGYRTQGLIQALVRARDWLHLELGTDLDLRHSVEDNTNDVLRGSVLNSNNMNGRTVREFSVLAQAEIDGRSLASELPASTLVGVRYTQNEISSSNLSLRWTLAFNPAQNSSLKLLLGQSFRAPTLFEFYYESPTATMAIYGNTGLKAETSTSVELSYLLALGKFYAQVAGYYAAYNRRIHAERRFPGDPNDKSLEYVNGEPFAGWGAEVELKFQDVKSLDAFLNYTLIEDAGAQEKADSSNFGFVPKHQVSLGLAREIGPFSLSSVTNYVSKRNGPTEELGAQLTLDLSLSFRSGVGQHVFSAKNVLDEAVQIPSYTDPAINSYPSGYRRRFLYSFKAAF
ncbi:MAG: TonB-dependent receptor [Deltaproteobacteria bacterium]|nr:TonB-dependent receptor [Deltaproteobacteria bacterium]